MRTWTYDYKTSDGLRHTAEIIAETKDKAYALLRDRGIHPIRVTERIVPVVRKGFGGLRIRDWLVVAVLIVALVLVAFLVRPVFHGGGASRPLPMLDEGVLDTAYQSLLVFTESQLAAHQKVAGEIDYELLTNYALISNVKDLSVFETEILRGRRMLSESRMAMRERFRELCKTQDMQQSELQASIRRMYSMAMASVDASEDRLNCTECAIKFLYENRGAWSVRKGVLVWQRSELEGEFAALADGHDGLEDSLLDGTDGQK